MSTLKDEQHRRTIGRYEVFIYGQEAVLFSPILNSTRFLKPDEALLLLEWLHQHQADFYKALDGETALRQEDKIF